MSSIRWLNADSLDFLSKEYLPPGLTTEERIHQVAKEAERRSPGMVGLADNVKEVMHKGWASFSTPLWTNFGNRRGLPISCNGSFIEDSTDDIFSTLHEMAMMTKFGAGTSAYFGNVRHRGAPISTGGKSFGSVHFMSCFDNMIEIVSQASVRRGQCAVYLPIEHPDVPEMLEQIRDPKSHLQKLFCGVTISDEFMQRMIAGDERNQDLWAKVIERRFGKGDPYLFFSDTVNRAAPQVYKDKGKRIWSSNLCSEIMLSSDKDESFVCNLASMNALHWDEWKDTHAVRTMTFLLDAVMSEYIEKVALIPAMRSAYNFAVRQRALGLGVLGWHSYLQSKNLPFESMEAKFMNTMIHKHIAQEAKAASVELAERYGEPELLEGYGIRNVTNMAIAPTTSSSFVLGQVSAGIEPIDSNYFNQDLQNGKYPYKNPYLVELLKTKGVDNSETWRSILTRGGSVQHLECLTAHEKDVFKTFSEISPKEIVIQAAARQKFVDQGQSLNLRIPKNADPADVSQLYIDGWEMGIKSFYYQKGANAAQELSLDILTCKSCEA